MPASLLSVSPSHLLIFFVPTRHEAKLLERATPRVMAFDIETTKQPLKFPNPLEDNVMMISCMHSQGAFRAFD